MPKVKDTKSFIEKAIRVHGDKYDYSRVVYINNSTKVDITCPIHGSFWQRPSNHIHPKAYGCPRCGGTGKYTQAEIKQRLIEVRGDIYDYSEIDYIDVDTPVKIICSKHGEFYQTVHNHMRGQNCPVCSGHYTKSVDELISTFREVHGDRYDYSKVIQCKMNDFIEIICTIHGVFYQQARHHQSGHGCPDCGHTKSIEASQYSPDEFLAMAKEVHGDRYDYDRLEYTGMRSPIIVHCTDHGYISMMASNHLRTAGCPECGRKEAWLKVAKGKLATLYVVKLKNRSGSDKIFYKFGITTQPLHMRLGQLAAMYMYRVIIQIDGIDPGEAFEMEATVRKIVADYKYHPSIEFGGDSECFQIGFDISLLNLPVVNQECGGDNIPIYDLTSSALTIDIKDAVTYLDATMIETAFRETILTRIVTAYVKSLSGEFDDIYDIVSDLVAETGYTSECITSLVTNIVSCLPVMIAQKGQLVTVNHIGHRLIRVSIA